jgi:hypothetical protein
MRQRCSWCRLTNTCRLTNIIYAYTHAHKHTRTHVSILVSCIERVGRVYAAEMLFVKASLQALVGLCCTGIRSTLYRCTTGVSRSLFRGVVRV